MRQLFFDFDGTIADSEVGILNGIHYMVNAMDLPLLDDKIYRTFIGPALSSSIHNYYPELSDADVMKTVAYYQEYYTDKGVYEMTLYPEIVEILQQLREAGMRVNIASAKPEPMLEVIVPHFGLTEVFDGVYGATLDERVRSTKTQVVTYALEQTQADKAQSLMIGDRDNDMVGASENGIKSLGVLYGFGDRAELSNAGATHLVEQVTDIPDGVSYLLD